MPNFAIAIAAKPPANAIAARQVVPAAWAASATVMIATTDIAIAAAAKVEVGGTVPVRSWMLSTTTIATSPNAPAAAIQSSALAVNLGTLVGTSGRFWSGGIGLSIGRTLTLGPAPDKGRLLAWP